MEPPDTRPPRGSANGDGASPDARRREPAQAGYGRKQVVFDVDFDVHAGEIVGILGHNGSGKSTTIRTILGINKPFGGSITFDGHDVTKPARAPTSRPAWR